ncbi:hypothetical protein L0244_22110 [bacterium]|nr:hypothetical protein [bacterium]
MATMNQLMQTNGTIDTFYKYKNRVIPSKIQCNMPNAMCTPDSICKPGFRITKKLNGMFCCPDYSLGQLPKPVQPCYKIGFGFPHIIQTHPQTHEVQTYQRERRRRRGRTGGANHQNKVVEPDNGGISFVQILLIGGVGYLGYKAYKKYKRKVA